MWRFFQWSHLRKENHEKKERFILEENSGNSFTHNCLKNFFYQFSLITTENWNFILKTSGHHVCYLNWYFKLCAFIPLCGLVLLKTIPLSFFSVSYTTTTKKSAFLKRGLSLNGNSPGICSKASGMLKWQNYITSSLKAVLIRLISLELYPMLNQLLLCRDEMDF